MGHDHSHHDHTVTLKQVNTAFIVGIVLNLLFVLIEAGVGFYIHSLSLLSDAGHNLADVAALGLSLLAFKLLKVRSNKHYTYGYRKTSILVALFNSMVLLVSIGAILYEATLRFLHPEPTEGTTIAVVAGIGILINSITAFLFFRNKDKDINVKSAYLHLLSDAVVSLAIVIGGVIIFYTGWFWVDSLLSIVVALIILISTWRLLKDSLRLSLDGVPENVQLANIETSAKKISGIKELHHIHVWAISTTENAMTAHVVLAHDISIEEEQQIKSKLKHELLHQNIHHITLETERTNEKCNAEKC